MNLSHLIKHLCKLLVIILLSICEKSKGVSLEEDLTITYDQKLILTKFKDQVIEDLPHEYMKKDIYLIRWLRARDFDIQAAQRMLYENLRWRKENNMDTIHQEDWSDFENNYKYWTDGHDKDGRPIAFLSIGTWDLRKAIVMGQRNKMLRYIDKAVDHMNRIVREEQDQGKNVSQYNFIVNLAGYTVAQQGCLQCIQVYIHLVSTYEQHFPNTSDKLMTVNTPGIFEVILNAVRPFMSPQTRAALKVYGTNRREWEPILFRDIDRDQLPTEIKGTKIYDYDN